MAHTNSHTQPMVGSAMAKTRRENRQRRHVEVELTEDNAAVRTISSREQLRQQLAEQVDAFLARGGAIEQLSPHATGDPITRPQSGYGGGSI